MEPHSSSHSRSLFPQLAGTLVKALVDILFPPRCLLCQANTHNHEICIHCAENFKPIISPLCTLCGAPFLTEGDESHLCGGCIKETPPFDIARSLFYYNEKMSFAIQRLKYAGKSSLAIALGRLLFNHPLTEETFDRIVPVPLHISRLRERGFNQSQLIARRLEKKTFCPVDPFIIERTKRTLTQVGMKRKERILNVKGAFRIRDAAFASIRGESILLIDDVFTTGATVGECSRILKKGGAEKVSVLTLARVCPSGDSA